MDEAQLWDSPWNEVENALSFLEPTRDYHDVDVGFPGLPLDDHEVATDFQESDLQIVAKQDFDGLFDPVWDLSQPGCSSSNDLTLPTNPHESQQDTRYTCQVCNGYFCMCKDPVFVRHLISFLFVCWYLDTNAYVVNN